jgi:hypothetical protein
MTLQEIYQRHPNEWVLIEFTELDDEFNVVDGEVVAHSPSKEEIDKVLMTVDYEKLAIEFTGERLDSAMGYLL